MSFVAVFCIKKNGDVVTYSEAHNNHAGAPLIWRKMIELYCLPEMNWASEECIDPLFTESNFEKYSREHKILLLSTCDRVWIKREIISELITTYRNFHNQFVRDKYVDTVNQLATIVEKWYSEYKSDIGIAFNMCSAITPFWYCGTSKPRPYNVFKDKKQRSCEYIGKGAWELSEHMRERGWL
jgi:hypothetical protein